MPDHDLDHETIAPRLMDAVSAGCEESRLFLSRRALMGMSAGLFSWACVPRHAEAFDGDRRLLIVLMRGGLDGLHVAYQNLEREKMRSYRGAMYDAHSPTVDYLTAGYRNLGTTGFRINGQLSNFLNLYNSGEAALVHSIAPPLRTRSHFDCMDNVENGQAGLGNPTKDGWLNRFLAGLQDNEPSSRGLATSGAPLILKGEAQVQSWTASFLTSLGDRFDENLAATYGASSDPLFKTIGSHLISGMQTNRLADMTASTQAVPESPLTRSFRGTARLMKAPTGPRVAVLSVDGLDTHEGQIMVLDSKLKEFDNALESFRTELGPQAWARTVVVCVTEFGRTLQINARGTDHGTGTVALLAGGNVNGGRVIADWPGISKLNEDRDLRATFDLRGLFKGVLRDHLGLWKYDHFMNSTVFPESAHIAPMSGIIRMPALNRLRLKV
jgi:uncharacterized protein (DUF1501 family)